MVKLSIEKRMMYHTIQNICGRTCRRRPTAVLFVTAVVAVAASVTQVAGRQTLRVVAAPLARVARPIHCSNGHSRHGCSYNNNSNNNTLISNITYTFLNNAHLNHAYLKDE